MVFLSKYFTNIIYPKVVMKQKEIIKKIGVIINELQDQYQYIEKTKGVINDLELELFVANTHFLNDHIEVLRKINEQQINAMSEKSHITEKFFEPVVQPVPIPEKKDINVGYPDFTPAAEPTEETINDDEPAEEITKVDEPIEEVTTFDEPVAEPFAAEEPAPEQEEEALIKHEMLPEDTDEEVDDNEPYTFETEELDEQETGHQHEEEEEHHFMLAEPADEPKSTVYEWEIELEKMAAELEQKPEPVVEPEPQSETPIVEPESEPPLPIAKSEPEPELPIAEPEPEVIETSVETEPEVITPVTAEPEVARPPAVVENFDADRPVLTINQILAAQLAHASRLQDQLPPIKDLKSAINLNDKMLYVRDLFNSYSLSYSEAIEILNRFKSFEEADQFLQNNYAVKNNWADKPGTVEKFYGLLRRRFA